MKKNSKILSALLIGGSLLFTACVKDEDNKITGKKEITSSDAEQSDDVNEEMAVSDEAIDAIADGFTSSQMRVQKLKEDECNVSSVVDTVAKSITFTFNGLNCLGTRTREGVIVAKLVTGKHWAAKGSQLEIIFKNYKVTRKADGKNLTLNGRHLVTNVSGSLSLPIVHTIHGTIRLKFNENTERVWKVARKRSFTLGNNEAIWVVSADSVDNISEAGVNREGNAFVTKIPTDIVVKTCGTDYKLKLTAGKIEHVVGSITLAAEFGYKSLTEKASVGCEATGMLLTYSDVVKQEQASKYEAYK